MKTQQDVKKSGNMQGQTTSNRAFNNQREDQKQQGISNSGWTTVRPNFKQG
jgi:hypothetical protein